MLATFLATSGIDAAIIAPGVPMPTVPLAAAAIGVSPEAILKSVLFRDRNGAFVLAIARGPSRFDVARLATVAGLGALRLADAPTVLAVTGYPVGGVPPVGHRGQVQTVLDSRAAALPIAYGGGGAPDLLLRIQPLDVVRLTGATVAAITREDQGTP